MDFQNYKEKAVKFAVYPVDASGTGIYPHLAIIEELGECFGVFAKCNRKAVRLDLERLCDELGDVCWNLAAISKNDDAIIVPFESKNTTKQQHGDEMEACVVEQLATAMRAAASFRDYDIVSECIVTIARLIGEPVSKFYEMNLAKLSERGAKNAIARL